MPKENQIVPLALFLFEELPMFLNGVPLANVHYNVIIHPWAHAGSDRPENRTMLEMVEPVKHNPEYATLRKQLGIDPRQVKYVDVYYSTQAGVIRPTAASELKKAM